MGNDIKRGWADTPAAMDVVMLAGQILMLAQAPAVLEQPDRALAELGVELARRIMEVRHG